MRSFRHRYVTSYIDSFVQGSHLYLVMEYCQKGDLSDYLARMNMTNNCMTSPKNSMADFSAVELSM
jgi:serine/threonine protein kinase